MAKDENHPLAGDTLVERAGVEDICGAPNIDTGEPCQFPAGYGTETVGVGPCYVHAPEKIEAREEKKRKFLDIFEEVMTRDAAASAVGVDRRTVSRWMKQDPEFARTLREVDSRLSAARVVLVEDSMFHRVSTGQATAAETIFWLCNRASDRWRDVRHIEADLKTDLLETLRETWKARMELGSPDSMPSLEESGPVPSMIGSGPVPSAEESAGPPPTPVPSTEDNSSGD